MDITRLDLFVLKIYNKLDLTMSGYESRKLLKALRAVENTPKGLKLIKDAVLLNAFLRKAESTRDGELQKEILDAFGKNLILKGGSTATINSMKIYNEKKSEMNKVEKIEDVLEAKVKAPTDKDKELQDIAQKVFSSLLEPTVMYKIKTSLEDRKIPLREEKDVISKIDEARQEEVNTVREIAKNINEFQKEFDNHPLQGELIPEDQRDVLNLRAKHSRIAIKALDEKRSAIFKHRQIKAEVIINAVKEYSLYQPDSDSDSVSDSKSDFVLQPEPVSESTLALINQYDERFRRE
ncbi:hypothetical protein AAIO65_16625 [Erwinia amylovora]|uniref:hypothetical protein n=1 Tax=Erwinia amylovora TaxID=552 RepID=UPI001443D85A|nr:hypothetical protein [Erwinia amylovora]